MKELLNTKYQQFIKEGSLSIFDTVKEIYIKLPNWGDVKISNNPVVTTLKIKVNENDNSGYKKYYYVPLCWSNDLLNVIELLLTNDNLNELTNNEQAIYYDMLGAGGK